MCSWCARSAGLPWCETTEHLLCTGNSFSSFVRATFQCRKVCNCQKVLNKWDALVMCAVVMCAVVWQCGKKYTR